MVLGERFKKLKEKWMLELPVPSPWWPMEFPSDCVVPYSNHPLVNEEFGFATPFTVALANPTPVVELVPTLGAAELPPTGPESVVKERIEPNAVPMPFCPTIRK